METVRRCSFFFFSSSFFYVRKNCSVLFIVPASDGLGLGWLIVYSSFSYKEDDFRKLVVLMEISVKRLARPKSVRFMKNYYYWTCE